MGYFVPRPSPLRARFYGMGKPLSRPDCLRQNPRCLKKGDDEDAYIEDCYVPQRSIYDTMRINEQIDQGSKISQPSRSTLGSGGGEGSTLSSNGTLGADIGGVFVARGGSTDAGVKKLDERVIFDALKLTGDPQSMPSVGGVGSSIIIPASNSAAVGAAVVTKRRHHVGDKKDNSNRRSWKSFMPPIYPEFAERLELSPVESGEKRLSGAGIPVSPLHPLPSLLTAQVSSISTPPLPPYSPSPVSSGGPHTPLVSNSPALTPSISPVPSHTPQPVKQKDSPKLHPPHPKQNKERPVFQTAPILQTKQDTVNSPQRSPGIHRQVERSGEKSKPTATPLLCVRSVSEEQPQHWNIAATKISDSERDSPFLEYDQDTAPLIPPNPVFCPPTKARTWPRTTRGGKGSFGHGIVLHNLPILPPLPPLLGEDSDLDEESLYLLDPPSPFLQEGEGLSYGGLPLSPCLSQEGGAEGLLGWPPLTGELRERTASELCFEEDERRILKELEEEEKEQVQEREEYEQLEMEEKNWQVVLMLDSHETSNISWTVEREESELQDWETKQLSTSDYRPLLTPPIGFGGSEVANVSPYPSSEDESVDLFLELERQCIEEEERKEASSLETALVSTPTEPPVACNTLPRVEEEEEEEREDQFEHNGDKSGVTKHTDYINQVEPYQTEPSGLGTDQNLSSKDTDDTQSWTASESYYDSDANASSSQDHTTPMLDICTLVESLLEFESSRNQTSHLDITTLSDTTEAEKRETDSDLGSGVLSEQEQADEVKDEVLVVHTSVSHKDLYPISDKLHEENNDYELDICKSDIKEDIIQLSLGTYDLNSNLGKDTEGNNCNVESHGELDPIISVNLNSDEEGMMLVMETYKELSAVTEKAFATEDMPVPEHELTEEDQRMRSLPESDTSALLGSVSSNNKQSPPHPPISVSTINESNVGTHDNKDTDSSVRTDSFVYLAVAVPSQYSQDCPPSPLMESTPPSPLSKPFPDPEEGAFLSSDSFVYLAAPERLPLVSDGGSAGEDCRDLDSESGTSQSGVDFVLGLMNEDSDWDSDESRPVSVPPCQDQWEQLEPGLLYRLFSENQYEQESSEPCDEKDISCRLMHPDEETSACSSTEVTAIVIYILMENGSFLV